MYFLCVNKRSDNVNQEWLLTDLHMHSQFSSVRKTGDKDKVCRMSQKDLTKTLYQM